MKKYRIILISGMFSGSLIGFFLSLAMFSALSTDEAIKTCSSEYCIPFDVFVWIITPTSMILGTAIIAAVYFQKTSTKDQATVQKNKDENKAKDDLISMTLHHIRTPLTGMMWSTKELSVETPSDNPQKNRIEKLHEETVRILNTVEKLLKTSRENTGRSSYSFETYPTDKLERLISESIAKMRPAAYAKDISVETETSPLSGKVAKIDSDKVITIVQTLFENAIHYTKSGGGIKIRMEEKGDDFAFYISDTGIGIPPEEQSKIFSQFYRSSNAKRVRSEGLGIGLFLAKTFVDAHNGSVTFNSTPHGTTFIVKFPIFRQETLTTSQPRPMPGQQPPTSSQGAAKQ